ncbi:MAG: hypothetical protein R2706_08150 [Acidimicrobiales bacterium]
MNAAVTFTDIQAATGLFVRAMLGRAVRVELLDETARGWPWLIGLPEADVIRVPAMIDSFADAEASRLAYRAQVVHQCAFTLFGTFAHCDDDHRRPTDHERIATAPNAAAVRHLVVLLENARVRAATARRFPGSTPTAERLQALRSPIWIDMGRPRTRSSHRSSDSFSATPLVHQRPSPHSVRP